MGHSHLGITPMTEYVVRLRDGSYLNRAGKPTTLDGAYRFGWMTLATMHGIVNRPEMDFSIEAITTVDDDDVGDVNRDM
jgi:hypothetical protein